MNEFTFNLRIYYEDTDAAGIVYYANYLKFMERARAEYLRSVNFNQANLKKDGYIFVVHSCSVRYLAPAKLDDELNICSKITKLKKTSMLFAQTIMREDNNITTGEFTIACLNADTFKPQLLPPTLREYISCRM